MSAQWCRPPPVVKLNADNAVIQIEWGGSPSDQWLRSCCCSRAHLIVLGHSPQGCTNLHRDCLTCREGVPFSFLILSSALSMSTLGTYLLCNLHILQDKEKHKALSTTNCFFKVLFWIFFRLPSVDLRYLQLPWSSIWWPDFLLKLSSHSPANAWRTIVIPHRFSSEFSDHFYLIFCIGTKP